MGKRAKFRDQRIEQLSQAIDGIITVGFADNSTEVKRLWRAIKGLRGDEALKEHLIKRLKRYEDNLLRLQADAAKDLNSIFVDSESFRIEREQGLRFV